MLAFCSSSANPPQLEQTALLRYFAVNILFWRHIWKYFSFTNAHVSHTFVHFLNFIHFGKLTTKIQHFNLFVSEIEFHFDSLYAKIRNKYKRQQENKTKIVEEKVFTKNTDFFVVLC